MVRKADETLLRSCRRISQLSEVFCVPYMQDLTLVLLPPGLTAAGESYEEEMEKMGTGKSGGTPHGARQQ